MKKSIFLAVAAVAMTACSNDVDLGMKDANKQTADNAIGFEVRNSNMSRGTQGLEATGHYNFGVWAYKDLDPTHAIMANYLVGYFGDNVGYKRSDKQTTYGTEASLVDLKSRWAYEGLGTSEYDHASNSVGEKYYRNTDTDKFYMSNWSVQYLRYWDYSSASTNFYAYAPYIHGSGEEDPLNMNVVTFNNTTHEMTFPAGTIKDGYDDPSKYEYLYAAAKVNVGEYGKDVALTFKHINSKIMITFWEDIAGYSVKMINLREAGTGVTKVGISAAPAKINATTYVYGKLAKSVGATLTFTGTDFIGNPKIESSTFTDPVYYQAGADVSGNEFLTFEAPVADKLATTKDLATQNPDSNDNYSKTVYYGIPKDNTCGLTFHVSFVLTNEQTKETITVKDAKVFVPAANCEWLASHRYIYVFKITKNVTGSTDTPTVINPGDPNVPSKNALYPIVFDNIQVEDWENTIETEHPIN